VSKAVARRSRLGVAPIGGTHGETVTAQSPAHLGKGQLALVATPIGNLGDITARAVEWLAGADAILAEDTRRARALLCHLGLQGKRVERFDAHAERERVGHWVVRMQAGERLGLLSDAGTPAVSDPGSVLVRACVEAGVAVTPIPGASAVMAAVAASGLCSTGFRFFGFLPRAGAARTRALELVLHTEEAAVLFESPRRLGETLGDLGRLMPTRQAVCAREMTKVHEEFLRGTVAELERLSHERAWQGEIVLVLGPCAAEPPRASWSDDAIAARIDELRAAGLRPKDMARALALETGLGAADAYCRICARPRQG
jgi:16S rRNA (cytidine1402-2'-O)-methyltransferase